MFHLDASLLPDVTTALAFAAPILLVDAVLMTPDWEAAPGAPSEESAAAAAEDGWASFTQTAALFQRMKVSMNPAQGIPAWQEGLLIGIGHLAEECLARGVVLTALSRWVRDRLFEADLWEGSVVETRAPFIALGLVMAAEAARKWKSLLRRLPVSAGVVGKDKVTGKTKLTEVSATQLSNVKSVPALARNADTTQLESIQKQVLSARTRANALAQLDSLRGLADWAAYGGAYLITGNLAAVVASSVVTDVAFSGYQRRGAARMFVADTRRAALRSQKAAQKALGAARTVSARIERAQAALAAKGGAGAPAEAREMLEEARTVQGEAMAALERLEAQRAEVLAGGPERGDRVSPAALKGLAQAKELLERAIVRGGLSEEELSAGPADPSA